MRWLEKKSFCVVQLLRNTSLILRQQSGRVASCEQAWWYAELVLDGLEDYLPLLTEASGSCYWLLFVYSEKELNWNSANKSHPEDLWESLKAWRRGWHFHSDRREEDKVGSWTGGNVDVGHSLGSNPKRHPGAHNFATKQCDRPAVLPALLPAVSHSGNFWKLRNVLVFAFVSFAKKADQSACYADASTKSSRLDLTKLSIWCELHTIHLSLGEASWVRDQILRHQFLQQQLQCRSRSTCGKETERPATQQPSDNQPANPHHWSSLIQPSFVLGIDKENADFRRILLPVFIHRER